MTPSAFVRRALLATGALGVAGTAAVAYAGSHDDEPNPEVSFFERGRTNNERPTSSTTTSAFRLRSLFFSALSPYSPSLLSLVQRDHCEPLQTCEAKRRSIEEKHLKNRQVLFLGAP